MSVEQTFSLLATTSFALKLLGMIIFLNGGTIEFLALKLLV
jgi:hypothetical protein